MGVRSPAMHICSGRPKQGLILFGASLLFALRALARWMAEHIVARFGPAFRVKSLQPETLNPEPRTISYIIDFFI